MNSTFENFTNILVDIYWASHDETAGAIPGCDCGCGGDSYDWDEIFKERVQAQAVFDLAVRHLPFKVEDLERMAQGWDRLGDLPDPRWSWYEEDGDYDADLAYHAQEVDEYGYHIAWAVHQLQDFDWTLLEVEEG